MGGTRWTGWVALALLTVVGVQARATEARRALLRVNWVEVDAVTPDAFDAMARESASILQDVGLDLVWERVEVGLLPEGGDLTVILLNSRPRSPALSPRCMGAVKSDATPRAVWLYFPNVVWALGADSKRGPWSPEAVRDLGVALGRVAAHEIVHALAPEVRHASHGLMVESLGRADLVGAPISLDEPSRRALLSRLAVRQAAARAGR